MTTRAEHGLPDEPPGRQHGGPAFPSIDFKQMGDKTIGETYGGMTLRDYFAAAALQGMFANANATAESAMPSIAAAYRAADLMLAERAK